MAIKWRCTLCGECCKRYVPLVLPEDVRRIQDNLRRPLSEFLTFYRPDDFEEPLDPSDERFFETKDGRFAMGLSRVDLPDGSHGCVFLKDNVCSIHAFKPYICRQYPFEPVDAGDVQGPFKLMDNPCFGRHAEDEEADVGPARRNYMVYRERQDDYYARIREWNANPRSKEKEIEDFLLFVGLQWSQPNPNSKGGVWDDEQARFPQARRSQA